MFVASSTRSRKEKTEMAFRNPLIEYVKAAFTWRWNLLTFGAGVALSILSPATSVILPLVLAAEISYLALLTSMPRFRKSVDARGLGIAPPVNDALLMKQIKAALKPEAWMRFEYLRDRCIQLGGLAKQFRGPDSVQDLTVTDLQTGSLERLLWMFLKLLYSQDALTRFIKGTDRNDLGRQVAATEKSLSDAKSRERGQNLVKSLEDKLETLKQRVANYDRALENLELLQAEIDRIEQKVNAISEGAINARDAGDITAQVDGIAAGISATEQAMKSLDVAPVFQQDEAPKLLREEQ